MNQFWTTRLGTCGSVSDCDKTCDIPGLQLLSDGTISNKDWLTSLAINILMTDSRSPDSDCGYAPNTLGGHWSESFSAGLEVGCSVRRLELSGRVYDKVGLIKAFADDALQKMVKYGVASSVTTEAEYIGKNRVKISMMIKTPSGEERRVAIFGGLENKTFDWSM